MKPMQKRLRTTVNQLKPQSLAPKYMLKKKWRRLLSLGCYFFVDPILDSESVTIFWAESVKSIVLKCTTYTFKSANECFTLKLKTLNCKHNSVSTVGGKIQLSLSNKFESVQLIFNKKVDFDKPLYFTISVSSTTNILQQVDAIKKLENILSENGINPEKNHSKAHKFANPEILYAYDFIKSGNSQRELARNLFGNEAIINDWDGINDSLRARTRRLIAQGKMFVNKSVIDFF